MFIGWDDLISIITDHCLSGTFKTAFEKCAINEKVALCMENKNIRAFLEQWLDNVKFNNCLKNSAKSKETRLKANDEFKKGDLAICCKLYTQAAQFAPNKSIELALAYSNRSAVYKRLNNFNECIKDINYCLEILEIINIDEAEVKKGQLIVKLLKRKIECLMVINQFINAHACWKHLLELTKNVYTNESLDAQFVKVCTLLSKDINNGSVKDTDGNIESKIALTEDIMKKKLEINKIILPFKSPKIKLCYSEAKGRHFVAKEKIKYGELLIFEDPFAFVLIPDYFDSFCYNCCLSVKHYSIPCNNCSSILFCGDKCRDESWKLYHRWECQHGTSVFECIGIAHLALRLTFETLHPNSKNEEVYKLLTHIDDLSTSDLFQYSLTATLLLIYLQNKTDFFHCYPNLVFNNVGFELLQHITRLVCNGNAISSQLISDYETEALGSIVNASQPRIGTAIFPTSSLLNHSCDPNIFSSNILKYVVVKASRDIEKEEEIFNCYGPNCRRTPVACRQASLKAQYHFDCKCIICINPHEDNKFFKLYEGLLCLTCNHEINATLEDLNNSDKIYCDLCPVQFNTTDYKNRLTEANKLYNEGLRHMTKNDTSQAICFISESLRLYTRVLNQKNSYITQCEDSLAKCFAATGDYSKCYTYLNRTLKVIEERFGKYSLEVAFELDKISDIMVQYMDTKNDRVLNQKALKYVRQAKIIFDANLSAWDIPYCESGIDNINQKEKILLNQLEGRSLQI